MMQKPNVPPGYRFVPTDAELLLHYLKNKNLGRPLPIDIIPEYNIYELNPDNLARNFGAGAEKEMYFFTRRERRHECGARPNRTAGDGYWRATSTKRIIIDHNQIAGYKMSLKFHKGKAPKGERTNWIMHEYRLDEVDPPTTTTGNLVLSGKRKKENGRQDVHRTKMNGFVLCRIISSRRGTKKISNDSENEFIDMRNNENIEEATALTCTPVALSPRPISACLQDQSYSEMQLYNIDSKYNYSYFQMIDSGMDVIDPFKSGDWEAFTEGCSHNYIMTLEPFREECSWSKDAIVVIPNKLLCNEDILETETPQEEIHPNMVSNFKSIMDHIAERSKKIARHS